MPSHRQVTSQLQYHGQHRHGQLASLAAVLGSELRGSIARWICKGEEGTGHCAASIPAWLK